MKREMENNINITKRLDGYDLSIENKSYFNLGLLELQFMMRAYI